MKPLPLLVVSGFLSCGKTRWIQSYLTFRRTSSIGVVYFERGMAAHADTAHYCTRLTPYIGNERQVPKAVLQETAQDIIQYLQQRGCREVIFEWNGMLRLSLLQQLLRETPLATYLCWRGHFYVTTASYVSQQLGRTGQSALQQLASADRILVDTLPSREAMANIRLLAGRSIPVQLGTDMETAHRHLLRLRQDRRRRMPMLVLGLALVSYLLIVYGPYGASLLGIPGFDSLLQGIHAFWPHSLNQVGTIILGIVLQAFPFLLLGTLVSAGLQLYMPARLLEKMLSQSPFLSLPAALGLGFLFPVCDCATIPVFRGLIAKRVPLPAAMTFMLSAPIINPIVILSTYYAFSGNLDIVVGRVFFGAFSALLISLSFASYQGLSHLQQPSGLPVVLCNCLIQDEGDGFGRKKWQQFLLHSKEEFLQVAGFLLAGSTVSACFQVYGTPLRTLLGLSSDLPLAIACMMLFAFLLSLCSSSDAMVARSLGNSFPASASMAFLLMGPIMDVKNLFVYSAYFPKAFCVRLLVTVIFVTLLSTFLFAFFTGGILI